MKKISLILSSLLLLSACGSDSSTPHPASDLKVSDIATSPSNDLWIAVNNPENPRVAIIDPADNSIKSDEIKLDLPPNEIGFFKNNINEDIYAIQQIASDYGSSQITIGNPATLTKIISNALSSSKSDFIIDSYKQSLYQIGRFELDSIEKLKVDDSSLESEWNYSANNSGEENSANTYGIVHRNDRHAYLIRYNRDTLDEIDVEAENGNNFFTGISIDLSAYTVEGASSPNPVDAVVLNNTLYILMQRQNQSFTAQTAYLAVFDISDPLSPVEEDTNSSQNGLKGIPLNNKNPSALDVLGNQIFVANRGDFSTNQGGLDVVNTTNGSVTTIIDGNTFPDLNTTNSESGNAQLYHITDVSIVDQNTAYAILNIEEGYDTLRSEIVRFNPTTLNVESLVDLSK
ncbi:hypothetical protein [Bermanella sp. R86510]|uniref:hypothetical protein n=1 Tax=unclassified Bermanella TaxID=2627862 RepID=UPI0037CB7850